MKKMLKRLVFLVFGFVFVVILFLLLLFIWADVSPMIPNPNQSFYFYDDTGNLGVDFKSDVIQVNKDLESTGSEVVVVLVDSFFSIPVDEFSQRLFDNWEIGGDKDAGILLLVSNKDRRWIIKVGDGLNHIISHEDARRVEDDYLAPYFEAGLLQEGISNGFYAILQEMQLGKNHGLHFKKPVVLSSEGAIEGDTRTPEQLDNIEDEVRLENSENQASKVTKTNVDVSVLYMLAPFGLWIGYSVYNRVKNGKSTVDKKTYRRRVRENNEYYANMRPNMREKAEKYARESEYTKEDSDNK